CWPKASAARAGFGGTFGSPARSKGLFRDILPSAPVEALALLRLDGDMYESTMDGLVHLYDKLSEGGTLIVDDSFLFEAHRKAVDEFRAARGIENPIIRIDDFGGYWIKGQGRSDRSSRSAPNLT